MEKLTILLRQKCGGEGKKRVSKRKKFSG